MKARQTSLRSWVTKSRALLCDSDTADLDATCLIMHVCQVPRAFLYSHSEYCLSTTELDHLEQLLKKRQQGVPIAYLTGSQEFWSLPFKVTKDTLIPRPDTESMVSWVLEHHTEPSLKVADLGTGSGAIAVALANEQPTWTVDAVDQSAKALAVARENAQTHQCQNIVFLQGDWCQPLKDHAYDLIVSNPPYIAAEDRHLPALCFEPTSALVSQKNGYADIIELVASSKKKLKKGGQLVIEHGYKQQERVLQLLEEQGYGGVMGHCDLAGRPRFATAFLV